MPTTSNFGWTTPADTDLVKDGAAAIRTLGNGIDTSFLDLKGGTTGQNLRKASNTDLDFTFAGDATNTVIDAEGDLLVGDSADTLQRLAVGTTGQVLTVDTTLDGKIKWATPAGGGKVLQVVQGTLTTAFTTTSLSYVDTGLSVSITPSSASSKVLIIAAGWTRVDRSGAVTSMEGEYILVRTSTQLQYYRVGYSNFASSTAPEIQGVLNFSYVDSPATTSATTYKVQCRSNSTTSTTVRLQGSATEIASIIALEIGA